MRGSRLLVPGVLLVALVGAAGAQEDRSQQTLARAQALLRQVSAQKQELEAANARLTAEVEALQKKLSGSESKLRQATLDLQSEQRKAGRTDDNLQVTRERLARTEEALREAIERLRNANGELRQTEQEKAALAGDVARLKAELVDSERKNLQLYQANVELLDLYRKKGPLAALLQHERVTGLQSVAVENTLLEYQAKLDHSLREANRGSASADQAPAAGGE